MAHTVASTFWQRMDRAEQALCRRVNRSCQRRTVQTFFVVVSRLGDGILWYALMAVIALADPVDGPATALRMAIAARPEWRAVPGAQVAIRARAAVHRTRTSCVVPHRSIATAFLRATRCTRSISRALASAHDPRLFFVLAPFAALVAASRVVLGLHYPTDVAAGALLGGSLAALTLGVWPT